jgi:hypothetical protein
MVEFGGAVLGEERVVDQDAAGEFARGLAEDEMRGVRDTGKLSAMRMSMSSPASTSC